MHIAPPGHIDHIKRNNTGSVYQLIDQQGPLSRIELSKRSLLAPASITKITRELLQAQLIKELEYQYVGSRGRPAIALMTHNQNWQFLSMRLGGNTLSLSLHELNGVILAHTVQDFEERYDEHLIERLLIEIQSFFPNHRHLLERIAAISFTLPGGIDVNEGRLTRTVDGENVNLLLAKDLKKATGLPVFVAQSTHSWALAEKWFGQLKGSKQAIFIGINEEIKADVIVNGKLLDGDIGHLGHVVIAGQHRLCGCGHQGCLSSLLSEEAIVERADHLLSDTKRVSVLRDKPLSLEVIFLAALNDDSVAVELIIECGVFLGDAIAMLVNVFHPQRLIIGGVFASVHQLLFPVILERVGYQSTSHYQSNLVLEESVFDLHSTMAGAGVIKQALYDGGLLMILLDG